MTEDLLKNDISVENDQPVDKNKSQDLDKQKQEALQLVEELKIKFHEKEEFRKSNQNASHHRPDESFFKKLDSTLKKNTSFVKKLGKITEQQRSSLSKELLGLNLTRYIQEIASTLLQSKIKMNDISCAVHISSLIHKRYVDFVPILYQTAKKIFQSYLEEKSAFAANAIKIRTDMRFISELTVAGILSDKEGLSLMHSLLKGMISHDKEKHELMNIIISFCKHSGEDLAGLVPRKNKDLETKFNIAFPKSTLFAPEKQKHFLNVLHDYWNSVRDHLFTLHKSLCHIELRNQSILQNKGELHDEKSKEFTEKQSEFSKLQLNANTLADLLDVDVPNFEESSLSQTETTKSLAIGSNTTNLDGEEITEISMWEDEDQKSFYTNLCNLQAIIPAILFKDGNKGLKRSKETKYKKTKKTTKVTSEQKPIGPKSGGKAELAMEEMGKDIECIEITEQEALEIAEACADETNLKSGDENDTVEDDTEEEVEEIGPTLKIIVENFMNTLKNCVNRELVDKAAQDFCMNMNTRPNRKRLARALFNVHRSRLDLLPFYARLTATLFPCIPDVAEQLSTMLLRDFRFHLRKKEQIHIESKVKTMRFIGEMTKFNMISLTDCLNCLKALVYDFSPHAIEMACGLLETCGYYALRHPTSHLRARVLLENLLRKQAAKALDQRYSTMIDNVRYTVDPPKTEAVVYKPRPKMHEFIRKLLYRDLNKSSVEKVLRLMRKLPWTENDTRAYIIKCCSQSWLVKYNNIQWLASLVSGLTSHRDDVAHFVVDDVLEHIRIGMEINHPKYNQRRVSSVKFLGELYNYRMVDSLHIFNVLYSFITFGVSFDVSRPSPLDRPDHLFRIRLVCVLLETCGTYFDRGSSKKKLDCFIPYFQRYIWAKKTHPYWLFDPTNQNGDLPKQQQQNKGEGEVDENEVDMFQPVRNSRLFPVEVDYLVQDTLEPLRPKLRLASNAIEMQEAVFEVERDMLSRISKVLPSESLHSMGEMSAASNNPSNRNLDSIAEIEDLVQNMAASSIENNLEEDYEENDEDYDDCSTISGGENLQENLDQIETQSSHSSTTAGVKLISCAEDDEFQKMFDSVVVESYQSRKQAKVVQNDVSVPINARRNMQQMLVKSKKGANFAKGEPSYKNTNEVSFALLTRKNNKATLQPVKISANAQIINGLRDRTQAEIKRKQELKEITLSMSERQVEEEQHQMEVNQHLVKQPLVNLNRERRAKYQPPKGAPNADLIFNSGGRRR